MSVQWDLEQMRLFVSVAEHRSFSAVARQQRKAQSAVSNGIAMLEADLGVSLFERSSGRQPRLTEAGSVLLEEAREVLRQCERLNGRALSLTRGEEACLRLAQDEAMLFQPVLDSLEALAGKYPLLEVQLSSAAQGDVARKLVERRPPKMKASMATPLASSHWGSSAGLLVAATVKRELGWAALAPVSLAIWGVQSLPCQSIR